MVPVIEYLVNGALLENHAKAVKVKAQATRYYLMNGVLYRRSFSGPYLGCLPWEEVELVMKQVHQGVCRMHIGGRTLCHRIITQGYCWVIMKQDS